MYVCMTAESLLSFLEEEYLSEVMLRNMRPRPGPTLPPGGRVDFEWGLQIAEQRLAIYRVRAEGVTHWSLDGSWDRNSVVEFESITSAVDADGITLVQRVPGRLELTCAAVSVERGPTRSFRLPAVPSPTEMLVWGEREVAWSDLLTWLDAPASIRVFERDHVNSAMSPVSQLTDPIKAPCFGMYHLQRSPADQAPWVSIHWMLAFPGAGHYFTLTRGSADDQAWDRMRRLPEKLGECNVLSGTVRAGSAEWIRRWVPRSG